MKNVIIILIKVYKLTISPFLTFLFGKGCRYSPTCSEYSMEAIEKHGAIKGGRLTIKRIMSCHPFSRGGYNPVPETLN